MKTEKEKAAKGHQNGQNAPQSNRGEKCMAKFTSSNGSVYGSLTLDIRKAGDYSQPLPVVVRIAHEGKKGFLRLGEKYTMAEWIQLCEYEKTGRRVQLAERNELKDLMEKIKDLTNQLIEEGSFSIRRLQDRYQGKMDEDSVTIYTIWDDYIQEKRAEEAFGTASVGKDTRNRFIKDNGRGVKFSDINFDFVQGWVKKMQDDKKSTSYIGINLRTFRTMVNIAIKKGYVKGNTEEMFKDSGYNQMESRKDKFLEVEVFQQLYEFWEKGEAKDENGKELFIPRDKNALFRDLGLFLFMYFANGQNLADTLRLEYDNWYFSSQGKQLRFQRHKTKKRNKNGSEVIFPVTPEIQKIIDRVGNEPKLGERVFPILSKSKTPEQEGGVIQRYNKSIRKQMKKVAEILKLKQTPTSTWARHSFATNLNNAGVPREYIKSSMAHSTSNDVTSKYIGAYPLPKMQEYNSYLLKVPQTVNSTEDLLKILKGMSEEERAALLAEVSK